MCCNTRAAHLHHGSPDSQKVVGIPAYVREEVVANPLPDGYWIEAFPFAKNGTYHDLVAYGLGFEGKLTSIRLFENPKNTGYAFLNLPVV